LNIPPIRRGLEGLVAVDPVDILLRKSMASTLEYYIQSSNGFPIGIDEA